MSKRDYTRYSNQKPRESHEKIQNGVEPVAEVITEEPKAETSKPVIGVVANCIRLNVRKDPSLEADIVCTIPCLTELEVNEKDSTDDFYKVITPDNVSGFCMKKFIVIRQES